MNLNIQTLAALASVASSTAAVTAQPLEQSALPSNSLTLTRNNSIVETARLVESLKINLSNFELAHQMATGNSTHQDAARSLFINQYADLLQRITGSKLPIQTTSLQNLSVAELVTKVREDIRTHEGKTPTLDANQTSEYQRQLSIIVGNARVFGQAHQEDKNLAWAVQNTVELLRLLYPSAFDAGQEAQLRRATTNSGFCTTIDATLKQLESKPQDKTPATTSTPPASTKTKEPTNSDIENSGLIVTANQSHGSSDASTSSNPFNSLTVNLSTAAVLGSFGLIAWRRRS